MTALGTSSSLVLRPRFVRALYFAALIALFIVAVLGTAAFYIPFRLEQGAAGLTYLGFVTVVLLSSICVWAILGVDYLLRRKRSWHAGRGGIEGYASHALIRTLPWSEIRTVRVLPCSVAIKTHTQPYLEHLYWIDPGESGWLKQLWRSELQRTGPTLRGPQPVG